MHIVLITILLSHMSYSPYHNSVVTYVSNVIFFRLQIFAVLLLCYESVVVIIRL